jgi:hypothetical protein
VVTAPSIFTTGLFVAGHFIACALIQIVPRLFPSRTAPASKTIAVFQSLQTCNKVKQTFPHACGTRCCRRGEAKDGFALFGPANRI